MQVTKETITMGNCFCNVKAATVSLTIQFYNVTSIYKYTTMAINLKFRNQQLTVDRILMATLCLVFVFLALYSPVWAGNSIESYLGTLLLWVGLLEIYDSFRRSDIGSKKSATGSGAFSLVISFILLGADDLRGPALFILVMVVFILDALRYFIKFLNEYRNKKFFWMDLLASIGNILLLLILYLTRETGRAWALAIVVALRIAGIGLNLLLARTGKLSEVDSDVLGTLGLKPDPYISQLAEKIKKEEETREHFFRWYIRVFILLLFFIHLGRMGLDKSYLGLLSPIVATLGDMVIALIIAYVIIIPVRYLFLILLRKRGQRLWKWITKLDEKDRKKISLRNFAAMWLTHRLRLEMRLKKIRYSFAIAVRAGLKVGLPWSALLAAVIPVLGMSWYFDTENWAAGVWDQWAATRTDHWRMAITKNTGEGFGASAFKLFPQGVNDTNDFSFVVIGDPGEGDASQLVLKDQLIAVSNHPKVKFVVISTDVVYPSGSMKDYEKKFWLPFKGVTKPVYAIPGNHDWYDALEGFTATFYEPEAAKKAMYERLKSDLKISSTTKKTIDEMVARSAEWRKEYEVPTGFQKAPYFQVSTGNFVFITVETGVLKQIDSLQRRWLTNVLEASKGKFVMVVLGHPFYAFGEYLGKSNPDFESIHNLLRKYKVPLVMAGDTHDLEYYVEPAKDKETNTMYHFVNGGGGAFLSIGTALAKEESMPTKDYAFYPSKIPLVKKIDENTSWLKYPAWVWTKKLNGWPFSAEWLSAMFDYNVSPYFQSFFEIKVERSKNRVVLIPYSNHGRIKWNDMTSTQGSRPAGATMDDYAEWVFPIL
jgi:uncharacterized membrane protein HdeD (DUF308 family)/3',5'-cyclic AMP phosphodiesterase CpdA